MFYLNGSCCSEGFNDNDDNDDDADNDDGEDGGELEMIRWDALALFAPECWSHMRSPWGRGTTSSSSSLESLSSSS